MSAGAALGLLALLALAVVLMSTSQVKHTVDEGLPHEGKALVGFVLSEIGLFVIICAGLTYLFRGCGG